MARAIVARGWTRRFYTRLAGWIVENPKKIIIVGCCLSALAAYFAVGLRIEFRFRDLIETPRQPYRHELDVMDRYNKDFTDEGTFVIAAIESDQVFSVPVLTFVRDLSRAVQRESIYQDVRSLAVSPIPRGSGDQVMTGPLYEEVPTDPAVLKQMREVALHHPLVVPQLLSKDGRFTLVLAQMTIPRPVATMKQLGDACEKMREVVKQFTVPAGVTVRVVGNAVVEAEISKTMFREQLIFGGMAVGLIFIVLLIMFGSFHGIMIPLGNVMIAVMWTVALMAYKKVAINLVSSTVLVVLLTYCVLDAIYLLQNFYQKVDEGMSRKEAVRHTIIHYGYPCALTGSTTAIGMAGFALSAFPVMWYYGLFLCVGIIIAYSLSILWVPALLCVLPTPKKGFKRRVAVRFVERVLNFVDRTVKRWKWQIIVLAVPVLVVTIWIGYRNKVEIHFIQELPQRSQIVKDNVLLSEKLSGMVHYALVVNGPPGSMVEPETLRALDAVDQWLEKYSIVKSSTGLADVVRVTNMAFHGGDPKELRIPDSKELIAQYLAMIDPKLRSDFVTEDYSRTHIRITTADIGSLAGVQLIDKDLKPFADKLLAGRFKLEYTGNGITHWHLQPHLTHEMIMNFMLAFVSLVVMMAIAFRSISLALLSVLPNLLPTTVCLTILSVLGVSLRTSTALFASVAVGMVFDNAIQFYNRLIEEREGGASMDTAMTNMLHGVGPAAIFTSLLIILGFGIFLVSDFPMLKAFGSLSLAVVAFGLLSDLFVTNAYVLAFGEKALSPPTAPPEKDKPTGG
jgi:uncharacterized protein